MLATNRLKDWMEWDAYLIFFLHLYFIMDEDGFSMRGGP